MGERERKMTTQNRIFLFYSCMCLIALLAFTNSVTAQSDDFNDNAIGSQWTLIEDSPATLSLLEQNELLEVIANAPPTPEIDAIYLSNGAGGFKLSTAADFDISIDYSLTGWTALGGLTDMITLVLGVGRDLDGTDSAAIGVGLSGLGSLGYGAAYRINDNETPVVLGLTAPTGGNMFVSYDTLADDLTLGLKGGNSYTLQDTVVGIWNADSLFVSFGARGSGHTLASGHASLDNFIVVPEPATATLLLTAAALALRRRRVRKHT